jgi:hypothetical protein
LSNTVHTCEISGGRPSEDTLVRVLYAINLIRSVADELRIFESIHHPNIINHYGVEIHRYQEESFIFFWALGLGTNY